MKKTKVEVQDTKQTATPETSADNVDQNAAIVTELTNDLQRTRADFENFRKQVEVQKTQAMTAAKYATVVKFLPLVDDFSRAIDAYGDQLAPLRKSLDKTLQGLGLAQIDSNPGTEFNLICMKLFRLKMMQVTQKLLPKLCVQDIFMMAP